MSTVTISIELPEELVNDANEFNLLTNDQLVKLIQSEVDRRVMEMVNAEIHEYRSEKAKKKPKAG